ncbi:MAG: RNA polymerase sigma factor [Limisphaerales bacterium]
MNKQMLNVSDMELLQNYHQQGSEDAFAELVRRHISLVYSAALRPVGIAAQAEEITQAVFIILARKAASLRPDTVLEGWLYETTRLTALSFLRGERRRQFREQEAYMQSTLQESAEASTWQQLAPLLDEAMSGLGKKDRDAVILRFFMKKDLGEVAAALKLTEAAAQSRVHRALKKLHRHFNRRGLSSTTAMIAGELSANSVHAAPVVLAESVTAVAVTKGAAASGSTLTLIKGALKLMAWAKVKMAVVVGVGVLLAGGVATVALSGKPSDRAGAVIPTDEQAVIPTGGHAGVTVFSLFEKMPIVANAVFQKELFAKGVPPEARKQTFSFKRDGDNYLLTVEDGAGIQVGRFGGVIWHTQGGQFIEYDPKINKSGGDDGGVNSLETLTRKTVDLFLTLGVMEIKPGSALWDEHRQRFTGMTDDDRQIIVDVKLESGVPSVATVLGGDGKALASIRYKYAATFYQGQVPVEFTRYWGSFAEDDKKAFTVQVRSLEISDEHLDTALIDPTQLFAGYSKYFRSNNIPYWAKPSGKVSRVLTMDEYKQEMERIKAGAAQRTN